MGRMTHLASLLGSSALRSSDRSSSMSYFSVASVFLPPKWQTVASASKRQEPLMSGCSWSLKKVWLASLMRLLLMKLLTEESELKFWLMSIDSCQLSSLLLIELSRMYFSSPLLSGFFYRLLFLPLSLSGMTIDDFLGMWGVVLGTGVGVGATEGLPLRLTYSWLRLTCRTAGFLRVGLGCSCACRFFSAVSMSCRLRMISSRQLVFLTSSLEVVQSGFGMEFCCMSRLLCAVCLKNSMSSCLVSSEQIASRLWQNSTLSVRLTLASSIFLTAASFSLCSLASSLSCQAATSS